MTTDRKQHLESRVPVVVCWTKSEPGEPAKCEIARTSEGLVVECLEADGQVLFSQAVDGMAQGLRTATDWKRAIPETNRFKSLSAGPKQRLVLSGRPETILFPAQWDPKLGIHVT